MAKFTRSIAVDAYQIQFDAASKESAKKSIPTTSHGSHIRYSDGLFSVLVGQQHAFEGDWVVTEESGFTSIVTDENFKNDYTEVKEPVADEPVKEPAEETIPAATVVEPPAPSVPNTPPVSEPVGAPPTDPSDTHPKVEKTEDPV